MHRNARLGDETQRKTVIPFVSSFYFFSNNSFSIQHDDGMNDETTLDFLKLAQDKTN